MEERNQIELRDYDNEEEIYSSVQVVKFQPKQFIERPKNSFWTKMNI
jgi:hypothetical protein